MAEFETDQEGWDRVKSAVTIRRGQLGFRRQEDIATKAKVGVETWRDIEGGRRLRYRLGTLTLIASALGWPPDMLQRIAEGEEPPREDDPELVRRVDQLDDRLTRLESAVDSLLDEERRAR